MLLGTFGAVIFGSIIRRGYKFIIHKMNERETRRRLEIRRRERRSAARNADEELPDSQRCCVCHNNPREIILLPCGHYCLCEDCSIGINDNCPICRTNIATKSAVFT